jgi:hypothetical protein
MSSYFQNPKEQFEYHKRILEEELSKLGYMTYTYPSLSSMLYTKIESIKSILNEIENEIEKESRLYV